MRREEPFDSTKPIDLFNFIQYTADVSIPLSQEQVLQTAYFTINASWLYQDECKAWTKSKIHTKA